jgi:hypothetical protein
VDVQCQPRPDVAGRRRRQPHVPVQRKARRLRRLRSARQARDAPGVQIDEATYRLYAKDGGITYRGFSFDYENYWRRINNFKVRSTADTGVLPFDALHDTGFQIQASAMVVPKKLQVYAGGSEVFGEYGDPSDFHTGATVFPWQNETVRLNVEYIPLNRSPVGSTSLPYSVGATGPVVHANLMIWF